MVFIFACLYNDTAGKTNPSLEVGTMELYDFSSKELQLNFAKLKFAKFNVPIAKAASEI